MKRIMSERIMALPHDIFADDLSDTDSATSNIDEDKRENPRFFHDDDHDYIPQTSGLSAILVRIKPTVILTEEEAPSISNKEASVPTHSNESPVEARKTPTPEETISLLDLVVTEINGSLVGPLFAKHCGTGVSVLWITSSRPTNVIGEIFVSSSGEVEVYIKGYKLDANHALWGMIPAAVPLETGGTQRFVQHVNHAVMVTRGFTICAGLTEQKHLWDNLNKVVFERNQFREPDVCRSESCDLLVNPQRVRCSECRSLWMKVKSRKKKKTADKSNE